MTLTIIYNDKCKQIINLSEKSVEKKTEYELHQMGHSIAHDLSRGKYEDIKIS